MLADMNENDAITYICRLMYEAYRIPVFWLDPAGSIRLALPPAPAFRPGSNAESVFGELADGEGMKPGGSAADSAAVPVPKVHTTHFLENYIILRLPPAYETGGSLVIGPSLSVPMTADYAAGLLSDHGVSMARRDEWLHYYQGLPVLERIRLYHAGLLLYSLVTGESLPVSDLLPDTQLFIEPLAQTAGSPDLDLLYRRENTWLHHDPSLEREMLRHIRNGDSAGLIRAMGAFSEESYGRLSKKSPLRSLKNLSVSSITLATRAAIAGGLFWEIAYTLSDFYIQQIEELQDIPSVNKAQTAALCDFADHVRDSRRGQLSRVSALCQNYIFNHLYEEITLTKLAEVSGLNPSYLSRQFKQENGIAISDYIQRERIEEAKRLLELPGLRLSDIASRLHFNDQSYFTKVFKKFTGVTPHKFRQERG